MTDTMWLFKYFTLICLETAEAADYKCDNKVRILIFLNYFYFDIFVFYSILSNMTAILDPLSQNLTLDH